MISFIQSNGAYKLALHETKQLKKKHTHILQIDTSSIMLLIQTCPNLHLNCVKPHHCGDSRKISQ